MSTYKHEILHKEILYESSDFIITKELIKSTYNSCQCYGDCGCADEQPSIDTIYSVRRKFGKIKCLSFNTEKEAISQFMSWNKELIRIMKNKNNNQ